MGEATFFSPGGVGGILWMMCCVGGFAIDTTLIFLQQLQRQWAAMALEQIAPSDGRRYGSGGLNLQVRPR